MIQKLLSDDAKELISCLEVGAYKACIKKSESEEIQKVMKRIDRNYDYYSTNPMIKGTFDFLKMVVDNWFKTV